MIIIIIIIIIYTHVCMYVCMSLVSIFRGPSFRDLTLRWWLLYHTTLHYTILYYTILYYNLLDYTLLYYNITYSQGQGVLRGGREDVDAGPEQRHQDGREGMHAYIYIYTHTHIRMYLSLSVSIYIYIYVSPSRMYYIYIYIYIYKYDTKTAVKEPLPEFRDRLAWYSLLGWYAQKSNVYVQDAKVNRESHVLNSCNACIEMLNTLERTDDSIAS